MFTEIDFTEEFTRPLGLKPKRLEKLKPVVVLAGPNGAGKSRYLRLVESVAQEGSKARKILRELPSKLKLLDLMDRNSIWEAVNSELQNDRVKQEERFKLLALADEAADEIKVIPLSYPPTGHRGSWDPHSQSPNWVEQTAEGNRTGGFDSASSSINAYFHEVARALHELGHERARKLPAVKRAARDAEAFNRVLRALLSARIKPRLDKKGRVIASFRGRPFDLAELSAGEVVLVGWAILLHRQKTWLRGAHVLIDEPENHLHPDVCIRALDALRNEILGPQGQIWLATHSVPLIAHAGVESLYLVDGGSIEYAGNKIGAVINRLMGGEEGRAKLRAFLADADAVAFDHFAAQCLLPPGVVGPREGDTQQKQMVKTAEEVGAHKEDVRILDFAAGRGRLAAALKVAGLTTNRRFTYHAYQDPRFTGMEERRECLEHIARLGQPGSPETYLVNTLDRLSVPGVHPMDLVVMCNVLHEIPVDQWRSIFAAIHEVLAEDGQLVILEDQIPSVGELPHQNGYVVLDDLALMELFGSSQAVQLMASEDDGRLTAYGISKGFLRNVTPQTLFRTLEKVRSKARAEILRIRDTPEDKRTFQLGRKHAHFTLLYANAELAIEPFRPQVK